MPKADPPAARGNERVGIAVEAGIRRSGLKPFRVRVFDLSRVGCKIEFIERPRLGECVWVKFDGLEALQSSVQWVEGHIGGVRFDQPFHEAVFAKLVNSALPKP